jgi:DNA polymerase
MLRDDFDVVLKDKSSPSLAYVPPNANLAELVRASQKCHACDLYKHATQTVFGEGPVPAKLFFVGEQPGDQEDKQGHPFVGPAGRVLDAALQEAGIPRDQIYVTNAVKHFKWEPRGKRRLHSKPNAMELHACHGWLETELALVKPLVIVCLGSSAARLFLGSTFKIARVRGALLDGAPWASKVLATYHPSALFRVMDDADAYAKLKAELDSDLRTVAALVGFRRPARAPTRTLRERHT